MQADTNYAQAKYGYLNDIVALRLAAGNLDRSTVELINSWLIEPRPPLPAVPGSPSAPATTPVMPLDASPAQRRPLRAAAALPTDPAPLSAAPPAHR